METAFVFISCEVGTTDTVTKKLQMINEINEVTPVWGTYDIVTKITASTREELRDAIRKKIRTTDNIRTTMSLMVTESQTWLITILRMYHERSPTLFIGNDSKYIQSVTAMNNKWVDLLINIWYEL